MAERLPNSYVRANTKGQTKLEDGGCYVVTHGSVLPIYSCKIFNFLTSKAFMLSPAHQRSYTLVRRTH